MDYHDGQASKQHQPVSRAHSSPESDQEEVSTDNRAKNALVSFWNNMRYGFHYKTKTKYNFDVPVCLLGQVYQSKINGSVESIERRRLDAHVETLFRLDVTSRLYFTYRRHFASMLGTHYTSDSGWGCMLRSGQMILAQGLLMHLLGRSWRWRRSGGESSTTNKEKEDRLHRMIVRLFADAPNAGDSPFSIHELVRLGKHFGKQPGDWFGPSLVSVLLKSAFDKASRNVSILQDIVCYVAQDCAVYLQDLHNLCNADEERTYRSAIILVPLRLGAESLNMSYSQYLKELMSMPTCLGVIGGRPRHSLYFIGYQQEKLLAIDPHHSQRVVDTTAEDFPLDTYHTGNVRKMAFHSMDPSCAIGFYLRDRHALDEFCRTITMFGERASHAGDYPIFTLVPEGSAHFEDVIGAECGEPSKLVTSTTTVVGGRSRSPPQGLNTSDDFVML